MHVQSTIEYRCSECGTTYPFNPYTTVCPACAPRQAANRPLRGVLEVAWVEHFLSTTAAPARAAIPRALEMMPVEERWFPPIPVGNTPLWAPERLRDAVGLPRLLLKNDTVNPTFSFKDRASYLVAAAARMIGERSVTVASTGNAASSMAGVGAAAGLDVTIYVPAQAPKGKLVQCRQYGANVVPVPGGYGQAFQQAIAHTKQHGGINRNTAYNPLTIEGKKSAAIEIAAQLRDHGVTDGPDYVLVPTGDAVILSGIYKGFVDLMRAGFTSRVPQLVAVQAAGSAALHDALNRARALCAGRGQEPAELASDGEALAGCYTDYLGTTVADSISVDAPAAGIYALAQMLRFKGSAVTVSDEAILAAQHRLAALSGLFAEPASAAALAGLEAMRPQIAADAVVVLMLTGSGLKDVEAAARAFA